MFELVFTLKSLAHFATNLLETAYELVGPLAPALFGIGAAEVVVFLFALALILAVRWDLVSREVIRAERTFMTLLKKANGTLANIAIITGFIGTYMGLMDVLPGLAKIVEGEAGPEATSSLLSGFSAAFVSSIAGLALGGIVGSVNEFLLDVAPPQEGRQQGALQADISRGGTSREDISQEGGVDDSGMHEGSVEEASSNGQGPAAGEAPPRDGHAGRDASSEKGSSSPTPEGAGGLPGREEWK